MDRQDIQDFSAPRFILSILPIHVKEESYVRL